MTQLQFIQNWLTGMNIGQETAVILVKIIAVAAVLLVSFIAFYIAGYIANNVLPRIIKRTNNTWDDIFVEYKVFRRLALIVPAIIIFFSIAILCSQNPRVEAVLRGALNLYFIIAGVMIISALISALHAIYRTLDVSRDIPLTSIIQVFKVVLYFVAVILCVSVIFHKSPTYLFGGLGAMTAVLLLIFKDPILGFVAGIQLISNKMLRHGDWIEMPKYGADGDVTEITLTTVKVRNFDNTISTVPTYALITDSYKNWRGMQESGGRRIKRAICIDMNTIKFCTKEMVERFSKIRYISQYMAQKTENIAKHNASLKIEDQDMVNRRQLTNIGTFRAYIIAYLQNHPQISQDMTFLVRQLKPTQYGLPLEIYVFCLDKAWANYEAIQADIFDHLLAIAPEFDLSVYQYPSGKDLSCLQSA